MYEDGIGAPPSLKNEDVIVDEDEENEKDPWQLWDYCIIFYFNLWKSSLFNFCVFFFHVVLLSNPYICHSLIHHHLLDKMAILHIFYMVSRVALSLVALQASKLLFLELICYSKYTWLHQIFQMVLQNQFLYFN